MFEKNLTDLVRGIRNNKNGEARYIASCLDEIKQELKEGNAQVKANAVAKLNYLQMLGYDISWAAFNIIEVMSSSKFTFKRVGYLAASNSFHEGLDILMLTTNMIRKDLCSMQMYDAGVAISGFSCFVTPDLARDLANDVMNLLVSTRPYIRKRAVLLMYKIFLKFPEALRPAFPRLKDKLEDSDPGVQSAAVNVICELARKNPKNYLSLAPLFFKLMTSSTNNWMLIKIIKLFGALCPLEPRLGKKLMEPLTNLIHSTSAMSLLYECINTVIAGLPSHTPSIQLCVSKLRILIEDPDQNLKYLGLLAMSQILKCQPKVVQTHKDLVMQCLDDRDESIRLRALDLIKGMVTKKNLMEIGKKLLVHIEKADSQSYRDEILSTLIQICSQSNYQYVTNFEWYIDVLVQLSRVEGTRHGRSIAMQMMDVTIRVKAIRSYAVQSLAVLLDCNHLFTGRMVQKNGPCEVLYAAAWVSGEFCDLLSDIEITLDALLKPKATSLPGHIQAVYVQSICKLYSSIMNKAEKEGDDEAAKEIGQKLIEQLPMFVQSSDLEVQERASCILHLIKYVVKLQGKGVACGTEVDALFSGELNPVAPKAQKKVPVPEGLDLDKWINDPPSESSEEEQDLDAMFMDTEEAVHRNLKQKVPEEDEEELAKRREQRRIENLSNPHYLRLDTPTKPLKTAMEVDEIPVAKLDLPVSLRVSDIDNKKYMKKGKKRRKGRKGRRGEEEHEGALQTKYEVLGTMEMPEGAHESGGEEKEPVHLADDPHRLLDVDLEKPLGKEDILPVRTHRVVSPASQKDTEEDEELEEKKSRKHRHKRRKDKDSKHKHKKEKEREEKKSHRKHKHHKKPKEPEENLMMNGEQPEELPSQTGISLASQDAAQATTVGSSEQTNGDKTTEEPAKSSQLDDMEFWLSNSDAQPAAQTPMATPSPDAVQSESPVGEEPKKSQKGHKMKHKKEKKEKHGKEKKKDKRRTDEHSASAERSVSQPVAMEEESTTIDITAEVTKAQEQFSTYRLLAENTAIKLTYETRVTPQSRNQVVASIVFHNLTDRHIKSMEFNVLDSLNTKLIRPIGCSSHDSVPVPFVLLPGCSNEGQFAFHVESIVMPQKLKGTLTYMIKDDSGATSEKIDFKLSFPCSAFLIATPFSSKDFANLLGSGSLTDKQSIKVTVPEETTFATVVAKICTLAHFAVVEQVDCNASLYACSIQSNHVCLLVKHLEGGVITVDGKSTDSSLVSNLLSEIKSLLQAAGICNKFFCN